MRFLVRVRHMTERIPIDYTVLTEDKPIHVRYTRIGQISEREAIAQGKERDEYMKRRKGNLSAPVQTEFPA